ncbi:Hypothetical predicted protein [Lecanosticta acicola]|uniref:Uncharacterized protein n=1 Tax=Lecanosticta acicola TaxID=111012 RepID=A0AAI8Z4Y2_9PEZI|nr:Hypothetical predicted protein [Lecanosticta acicola]
MAIPQTSDPISYIVYRDISPGEPFDPTSPLLFFPPKGSDELFDALRVAFPQVKTHSERLRDAIIQYLIQERRQEEFQLTHPSPATTMNDIPAAWPSLTESSTFSGSASLFQSPATMDIGTPASFSYSAQNQARAPQMTRQASVATSPEQSSPSLDQMTGVFSLSNSLQPKQRVRRKMTEAEKAEYRKRRIVKACSKCAERKRKCPHNQAQMETVTTSNKSSSRVSKSTSPKSSSNSSNSTTPPAAQQQPSFDASMLSVDNLDFDDFGTAFIPTQDFTMFEDPMADLDVNNFTFDSFTHGNDLFTPDVSPLQQTWPLDGQTGDSALLSSLPDNVAFNQYHSRQASGQHVPRQDTRFEDFATAANTLQTWESHFTGESFLPNGRDIDGDDGVLRGRYLQPGLHDGHAAHVHDVESRGLNVLDPSWSRPQEPMRQPSLPQTVLRLIGTQKALSAFLRLLGDRSSMTSISIEIDRSANTLRSRKAWLPVPSGSSRLPPRDPRDSRITTNAPQPVVYEHGTYDQRSSTPRLPDSGRLEENPGGVRARARPELRPTSTSVSAPQGSLQQSIAPEGWPTSSTAPAEELRNVPSSSLRQQGRTQTAIQHRHPDPSLGEGIPEHVNPSVELYMARKRISIGLATNSRRNINGQMPRVSTMSEVSISAPDHTASSRSISSTSSTVNGGAYPRQVEGIARTAAISGAISTATMRFEGPSNDNTSSVAVRNCSTARNGVHDGRTSNANNDIHGRHSEAEIQQPGRKRDTNRFKDHHGRDPSWELLVGLVIALLLSVVWCGAVTHSSMYLLALSALCAEGSVQEQDGDGLEAVQCTGKNSWWLTAYPFAFARGLAAKKTGIGKAADWSMYPHGVSPLLRSSV